MSEAKKRTFKNFPDNFTLGQCDYVFERNGFKRVGCRILQEGAK